VQRVVQGHLLAEPAFDGEQRDDLILVPNSKLTALRLYLYEDSASSHLRADGGGCEIYLDAAISTSMTQIHLLIQWCKPGVWVNPLWERW
jgi:hypothetical protein